MFEAICVPISESTSLKLSPDGFVYIQAEFTDCWERMYEWRWNASLGKVEYMWSFGNWATSLAFTEAYLKVVAKEVLE